MNLRRFIAILLMFCLPLQASAVLAMTSQLHPTGVAALQAADGQRAHAHHSSGTADIAGAEHPVVDGVGAAELPTSGCSNDAHCGGHCAPFVAVQVPEPTRMAHKTTHAPHVAAHVALVPPRLTLRPPIAPAS